MDGARYCATGAAPLSEEIQEYFASVGVTIFEVKGVVCMILSLFFSVHRSHVPIHLSVQVFGQSESTGLATANCPAAWKLGTVGRIYPGQEARLDPENGEYQYRGRHIFMG